MTETRPDPTTLVDPALFQDLQRGRVSRRTFGGLALAGAGFAAAVRPVAASTITTGTEGLVAGEVMIPTDAGEILGYRAHPEAEGPFGIVLVVPEVFGLHKHIRDVVRRFAKEGFYAIGFELFDRYGGVRDKQGFEEIRPVVMRAEDSRAMKDADAAYAFAVAEGNTVPEQLGITGFCWGGRTVWLYAAHQPMLKAGVAWYGRLSGEPNEVRPSYPIEQAGNLMAPVLGLYGGQDEGIPVEEVEKMRAALAEAGKNESEIIVYPEAPHAFFADYRPSYRQEAAEDAWARCLAWFRENGVA